MVNGEQKMLAIAAHLTYFLGGLGFVIAPLLIFLIKRDDPFVADHAKQALVAHLTMLVVTIVTGILSMLLIGLLLIPVVAVLAIALLITSIMASLKALNGRTVSVSLDTGLSRKRSRFRALIRPIYDAHGRAKCRTRHGWHSVRAVVSPANPLLAYTLYASNGLAGLPSIWVF